MYSTHGLHRAAQQQPDGLATVFGDRRRTFAEQVDRVARLAGALRGVGVRDGTPVGTLGHNTDRYAEALLATPRADGVLNVIDSMRAPFEAAAMLAESETEILFVDDALAPHLTEVRRAWPRLRAVVHMGESPADLDGEVLDYEELVAENRPVGDARRGGDSIAGWCYRPCSATRSSRSRGSTRRRCWRPSRQSRSPGCSSCRRCCSRSSWRTLRRRTRAWRRAR